MNIAALRSLFVLLALLTFCTPLFAQEEEHHEDHEALRELRRIYEQAANENNLDLLKPYLHKDFSLLIRFTHNAGCARKRRRYSRLNDRTCA